MREKRDPYDADLNLEVPLRPMKGRVAIGYVMLKGAKDYLGPLEKSSKLITSYCKQRGIKLKAILFDTDEHAHLDFRDRPGGSMFGSLSKEFKAKNLVIPRLWMAFKDTVDAERHIAKFRSAFRRCSLRLKDRKS